MEAGRLAIWEQTASSGPASFLEQFFALSANTTSFERKAWGKDLAAAFENFRVPAALVASSALYSLFALLPTSSPEAGALSVGVRLCVIASVSSFIASILTVALTTSALVQLNQHDSGRDSAATDLEDFMRRAGYSLDLWVAVNANFLVGVVSLCAAVGLHCWVVLPRPLGRIVALMLGAGVLIALSLGLPGYSLVRLLGRYLLLLAARAASVRTPAPGLAAAIAMMLVAVRLAMREIAT